MLFVCLCVCWYVCVGRVRSGLASSSCHVLKAQEHLNTLERNSNVLKPIFWRQSPQDPVLTLHLQQLERGCYYQGDITHSCLLVNSFP